MELKKQIIIDCIYKEAAEKNINFDHGKIEMYVNPTNDFSCPMNWMVYDKKNQFSEVIFFLGIQDYLKDYFKYNASKRIANKLTVEIVDGKVIDIIPSWDQSIVDEFYNNLPASKRKTHIGWYDKD